MPHSRSAQVLLGVARPGGCGTAVIATGGVTAPAAEGSYQLHVQELFANVIRDGETGELFYATDAAGVGTITNLTINVVSCQADTNSVVSSSPVTQKSLWKTQRNVRGSRSRATWQPCLPFRFENSSTQAPLGRTCRRTSLCRSKVGLS